MTEIRPGYQRDLNAVIDAFKAGLVFDPPVIAPSEYRAALRAVGYPLHDDDEHLEPATFQFPDPPGADGDGTPEEDE